MGIAGKPICVCLGVALFGTEMMPNDTGKNKRGNKNFRSIFTPAQDGVILAHYADVDTNILARKLGFSAGQIHSRARHLGVKKNRD